jgi:hypothetical protein
MYFSFLYVFVASHPYRACHLLKIKQSGFRNKTNLFIFKITDDFQLNLLNPTVRNISQSNSRRVLEKFFLELDMTAHQQFFLELSMNSN